MPIKNVNFFYSLFSIRVFIFNYYIFHFRNWIWFFLWILKLKIKDIELNETIDDLICQNKIIMDKTCQSEKEMNCQYIDKISIYPSKFTKESKVNELMQAADPLILMEADVEQTKSEYRTFNERLRNLEEKYNNCIQTISDQNKTIALLKNDLQKNLLFPLIIRELIKQSR